MAGNDAVRLGYGIPNPWEGGRATIYPDNAQNAQSHASNGRVKGNGEAGGLENAQIGDVLRARSIQSDIAPTKKRRIKPSHPLYKPASGIPASGAGYGGEASGYVYKPFTGATDPALVAAGRERAKTAAEMAREHVGKAVAVWERVMADEDAPPMARVTAADKMVERAEGKPVQPVVTATSRPLAPLDPDRLNAEQKRVLMELLNMMDDGGPVITQEG